MGEQAVVNLEDLDDAALILSETGHIEHGNTVISAAVEIAALREKLVEAMAERDLLQDVLDGRPAINAGLPESYVRWSRAVYAGDIVRASSITGGKDHA